MTIGHMYGQSSVLRGTHHSTLCWHVLLATPTSYPSHKAAWLAATRMFPGHMGAAQAHLARHVLAETQQMLSPQHPPRCPHPGWGRSQSPGSCSRWQGGKMIQMEIGTAWKVHRKLIQ